jgi:hypothetical protein
MAPFWAVARCSRILNEKSIPNFIPEERSELYLSLYDQEVSCLGISHGILAMGGAFAKLTLVGMDGLYMSGL